MDENDHYMILKRRESDLQEIVFKLRFNFLMPRLMKVDDVFVPIDSVWMNKNAEYLHERASSELSSVQRELEGFEGLRHV